MVGGADVVGGVEGREARSGQRRSHSEARALFAGLPPRYDRLGALLSLGQDRRWRRAMVDLAVGAAPGDVLDVATGPAGVALALAERTGAHVVGVDLSGPMLRQGARNVAASPHRGRVHLVLGAGEQLPFPDAAFDAVTVTYLLRYVDDPAATLRELARVLRAGGVLASLEFHVPPGPVLRPLWHLYTRGVLPVAGWVTGGRPWYEVGRFLGPSISAHYRRYPLSWQLDAWRRAGIPDVTCRVMSLGGGVVIGGHKASDGRG